MSATVTVALSSMFGAGLFFIAGYLACKRMLFLSDNMQTLPLSVPYSDPDPPPRPETTRPVDDPALRRAEERAKTAIEELKRERQELAARNELLKSKDAELERMRQERISLQAQIEDARKKQERTSGAEVEKLQHDFTVQNEVAKARAGELERVRQENVTLRQNVTELTALREEMSRLRAEQANLRAQGLVLAAKPKAPAVGAPVTGVGGKALQGLLEQVGTNESVRAAVIADEMGLLVASTGQHAEALGAFGAFLSMVGAKATELLPMRAVDQITVQDGHEVTVSLRRLMTAHSQLVLAMLTVGADTSNPALKDLLQRAPEISL